MLAPGSDAYAHRISVQSYDVTDALVPGENVLGIALADGWWAGRLGLTGSSAQFGTRTSAIWQLHLDYGDGTTDVYAITFAARDVENMLSWLMRFGAKLVNDEGTEFVLNSEEGVRALQFIVDLIYEYGYAPRGGEALDVYGTIENLHNGRAAIGYGGIYEIGRIDRYL